MGNPNGGAAFARGFGQPVIAWITVDLQDAVKAGEEGFGIFTRPTRGIEVDHTGWVLAAPWPVIACKSPEISCFGFTAPRIQHRGRGFVHEQLAGLFQVFSQPVHHRLQMERRVSNPIRQHGAVQIKTCARQDLALAV